MLFFLLFIVLMPALTYADYRLYGKKMEETLAAQPDYDQNRENYDALLGALVQRNIVDSCAGSSYSQQIRREFHVVHVVAPQDYAVSLLHVLGYGVIIGKSCQSYR